MFTARSIVALLFSLCFQLNIARLGYPLFALAGYWLTSYFFLKNPLLL